ncbi:MAG: hypothetical protein V8Q29_03820 [Alistipes shahii]
MKIGDVIAVRKMQVTYSYKVLDLVSSRQPAKNVLFTISTLLRRRSWTNSTFDDLHRPQPAVRAVRPRKSGANWTG